MIERITSFLFKHYKITIALYLIGLIINVQSETEREIVIGLLLSIPGAALVIAYLRRKLNPSVSFKFDVNPFKSLAEIMINFAFIFVLSMPILLGLRLLRSE